MAKRQYASYKAYNTIGAKRRRSSYSDRSLHSGGNFRKDHSRNGAPEYDIILNPGIRGVLCGWGWLNRHCADLVNYKPEVFMTIGNVRYTMTIERLAIIKDIMKANHLTRKQKVILNKGG